MDQFDKENMNNVIELVIKVRINLNEWMNVY